MEMKNILLRIESRLDDLTKAFHQIKAENGILQKEILGVSSTPISESMGLMETRTLREIVEETEFHVKKIKSSISREKTEITNSHKLKSWGNAKTFETDESDNESLEESADKYPAVEIRSKTLGDEREFLKETFIKLRKEKTTKDGESLQGTSVETISNSIPISKNVRASCTMKLSNFLDTALTDLQNGYSQIPLSGPSRIIGNFSEVFSARGDHTWCYFLCSFAISKVLRLTIECNIDSDDNIWFGIAFIPADVPTNKALFAAFKEIPSAADVWMMIKERSKIPLELYVTHGNLLVRGHMTNGPRSIVHVEILQLLDISWPISVVGGKKRITDGKIFELNQSTNKDKEISRSVGKCGRFSCNVEIVNCLNVSLKNRNQWYSNFNDKYNWPLEILSFQRESFLGSGDSNFEAMFSYEILSTDLALVIALKVGPGTNSFAAAFTQIPAITEKKNLDEALMNPSQWKIHDYKKYSNGSKALEVIRDRNIRAEILMTEEEKSTLKIRFYAV